jgi:S1-C subfamily serine protease
MLRISAVVAALLLAGCSVSSHQTQTSLSQVGIRDSLAPLGCGRIFDAAGRFHGSCFAIDIGEWLVVTAYHVVEDTSGQLYIEGVPAEIVRLDEAADLAVLRARGHPLRRLSLRTATLGEPAWALGYVGVDVEWEDSPSEGVLLPHLLSQTGSAQRGVTSSGATATRGSVSSVNAGGRIQFDGGVQPGMSGGPLLGADGRVLGCLSHCTAWGNGGLQQFSVNTTMARYARSAWIYSLARGVSSSDPALPAPASAPPAPLLSPLPSPLVGEHGCDRP